MADAPPLNYTTTVPGDSEPPGIVCEKYFQKIMEWARTKAPEVLR
jgi:hypothetical protein